MPKNLTGQQAGIVQGDQVNDPSVRVFRGKNLFPQSFLHPSSCRYGEVDVLGAMRCERGDIFPYKFDTELDTFTLQSPIKSEVNMYTGAFKVPMEAIYPRNWRDVMFPNPTKGDDSPSDCRAIFNPSLFTNSLLTGLELYQIDSSNIIYSIVCRYVFLLESVFSAGSIFSKFNMHLNAYNWSYEDSEGNVVQTSFDKWFDNVFVPWLKSIVVLDTDSVLSESPFVASISEPSDQTRIYYYIVPDGDSRLSVIPPIGIPQPIVYITFRRALELVRTGEYAFLNPPSNPVTTPLPVPSIVTSGTGFNSLRLNIEPIIAYKLVTSHFFVNSKVDFVYTAQLFRDNMQSLVYGDSAIPTFTWNGIVKQYDVFSERVMSDIFNAQGLVGLDPISYYINLFSWSRSLRYGDYFTGAHVEPLAVGDVNTPVTDGSVATIDLTKKLQLTRFLNKINIVGSRFEDYIRALFGGSIPEAPKDVPIRLSLEKSNIEGFEVNNTGSEQASAQQNLRTSNLKLNDSRFMFEAAIDEPCWIIVTRHFDVERIYSRTCDRFAFHEDRFDDFIPDMQFVGDQDVKATELDITRVDIPFAYNLRYMEYKNRYSYASGAFIEYLPSWAFITDNKDGASPEFNIDTHYIRSSPSEFDRFYKQFSGYSLASYFHFITFTTNVLNPYRQMVYAPEILS